MAVLHSLALLGIYLATVSFHAYGAQAAGAECTTSNPEYQRCLKGVAGVFNGATSADQIYQQMCSADGRKAMSCMVSYVAKCPELTSTFTGSVNMSAIQAEGGIDVFCEMFVGECSKIQQCTQKVPDLSTFSYATKLVPASGIINQTTAYQLLPYYLAMMCGPMKPYVLCFIDSLARCPKTIAAMEKLGNSFPGSSATGLAQPSFTQLSYFMKSYCTLDDGLSKNADCVNTALKSSGFSSCFSTTKRQIAGQKTCASYNAVKKCVTDAVTPSCGQEAARLTASGLPLFYQQLLPADCEPAVAHASITQMSVLTFLGAMLIYLLANEN